MFSKEYWDENYSEPKTMDCIGNAKEHCQYIQAFFKLELVDISSVIDFGFGYGHLFQKVIKAFLPYKACGLEPSLYAFNKATKRKLKPVESMELTLSQESLQQWASGKNTSKNRFDLGLCTSVLQYIPDSDLEKVLKIMSERVKYIYLTVPTDKELDHQVANLDFHDRFAIRRSRAEYWEKIGKYFTNISSKIWESKYYFNEDTTHFSDLLYRS